MRAWMGEVHERLAVAVQRLRAGVHARDPRAAEWATRLDADLSRHMDEEERRVLPRYAALRPPFPENATPEVFASDHALLREALRAIAGPSESQEASIARCDALWRLQGVLEHHDAREMRYLVPRFEDGSLEPVPELERVFEELAPEGPYREFPATWATDATSDAVADLKTALAGAAPLALVAARVEDVRAAATQPKQRALVVRLAAAVESGDRARAWDALRLVKAAGLPPRGAAR